MTPILSSDTLLELTIFKKMKLEAKGLIQWHGYLWGRCSNVTIDIKIPHCTTFSGIFYRDCNVTGVPWNHAVITHT